MDFIYDVKLQNKIFPVETVVAVETGTTLMEAAATAGIHINNLCGGNGVCGRCRVKVTSGGIRADKHSSGSGLIDCLYELAKNHLIDGDGRFGASQSDGRFVQRDDEVQFVLASADETETRRELVITQSDIHHLIRSKGAVFAAIKSLMDYVGISFETISTVHVAGGFGSHLDIPKAIGIGLLPDIALEKIRFVGNSSLMGARMCLLSIHSMERAVRLARGMTNIELSNYQPFMDEYVAAMFLPHTDRRLFPSVAY
jgi:uncharacterized 2Fe-2S/4Fe-4S cluster protein (DUF4445 family)